ncbi:hypothetical protein GEMRC1_001805 [Eukaryota sp. GEM-RC1]
MSPNRSPSTSTRHDSVSYIHVDSFSTLQEAQTTCIYEKLALENDGVVTSDFLLELMEQSGILPDDPRLVELFPEEDTVLSYPDFSTLLSNSCLVHRALDQQLIVPDWKSFTSVLTDIFETVSHISDGNVASYIPQLANVDPNLFGFSICSVDGQRFELGDAQVPFSIQSCSKPITYCCALEELSEETVHRYVGREPSGVKFNELQLNKDNLPHNPLINSGAIMVTSLIKQKKPLLIDFVTSSKRGLLWQLTLMQALITLPSSLRVKLLIVTPA